MATNYSNFNIDIETLSPLHIGDGNILSSVGEFLTTSDNIFFLDDDQLVQQLMESGHLDEYVQKILSAGSEFDFYQVLTDWKINYNDFKTRTLKFHQTGLITTHNNELHQCIKTNNLAYIPGSSIKGMLRTAILYKYLEDHPGQRKTINEEIENLLDAGKTLWDIKKYWTQKEKELLPTEVFHAIRPCDSDGFTDEQLEVTQVNRQHFFGVESEGLDWLVECIGGQQEKSFKLTLLPDFNEDDFSYLKGCSIETIFEIINACTLCSLAFEKQLLTSATSNISTKDELLEQLTEFEEEIRQSENKFAITRLGKGKTLFFQTILLLLDPEIREGILSLIKKEEGPFPQSRVLTATDSRMMGWIKLKYTKPAKKLVNNKVGEITAQKTKITAHFVETKKVDFMLNGEIFENVQLVNKFKQQFSYNQAIPVMIWQMSKENKIVQVKLVS